MKFLFRSVNGYGGRGETTHEAMVDCYGERITNKLLDGGARMDEWEVLNDEEFARTCTLYHPDGETLGTFYELRAL